MSWKTAVSRTVSGPVMFLQGSDGMMCASEVTAGWSKQISHLCDTDGISSLRIFGSLRTSQLHVSSLLPQYLDASTISQKFV